MNIFSDPSDGLISASLHGELTPAEQAAVEDRLRHDSAFARRYQENKTMHTLLQQNYKPLQPDAGFTQRILEGVQRRLRQAPPRDETAWESLLFLGSYLRPIGVFGTAYALPLLAVALIVSALTFYTLSDTLHNAYLGSNSDRFVPDTAPKDEMEKKVASAPDAALQAQSAATFVPAPSIEANPAARQPLLRLDLQRNAPANGIMAKAEAGSAGGESSAMASTDQPARKLVRNATLRLEVVAFPAALSQIAHLTQQAGGYLESQSSQRGGNGKLQGEVVLKVPPDQLDHVLAQLSALGDLKNQNITSQDITSAYYDLQARLDNQRRMEASLQELLQKENGKVSDLLQVERELGRVRGEIEAMQGQMKLYNFQVAYATVTITLAEQDLTAAAAYLLKENDQLTLLATEVEATYHQARQLAEAAHGEILNANVNRDEQDNITATLQVSIPPAQIENFLNQVKALGRVGSFTRTTQRVAQDGGSADNPADQTKTVADKVEVNLTITSRNGEPVSQTAQLSVLSSGIAALVEKTKASALASGYVIKSSTFSHQADGQDNADLSFKLPEDQADAFLAQLKALGSVESFTLQRQDALGQPGTPAPVQIDFHLHSRADLVADESGLFAMLRHTFSSGVDALLGSMGMILVFLSFLLPWALFFSALAWAARRLYIWSGRRS